jgi:protein N-terminal amidase
MNWLDPPQDDAPTEADGTDGPEESTMNYWAHRLAPLHDPSPVFDSQHASESVHDGKEVIFVACNRTGTEEGEFKV